MPLYPEYEYPNDAKCEWIIQVPDGQVWVGPQCPLAQVESTLTFFCFRNEDFYTKIALQSQRDNV